MKVPLVDFGPPHGAIRAGARAAAATHEAANFAKRAIDPALRDALVNGVSAVVNSFRRNPALR
jgi:hypothetical protein